MSQRRILEAFDRWREQRVPLVLVTVIETQGSTYSKAGHRILISGAGEYQGLVSGGCLEGDLAEHAQAVLSSGSARVLTYDLRSEDDELWGLGVGCNGMFRVLLQPLLPEERYAPFADIAAALRAETPSVTATVVESQSPDLAPGATLVTAGGIAQNWRLPDSARALLGATAGKRQASRAQIVGHLVDGAAVNVLYAPLTPVPRLLVLGAGPDAVPLIGMARRLGWFVTAADHRPAYLDRGDLADADQLIQVEPGAAGRALNLASFTAAIVMSHHLATDRRYLQWLAASSIPYIGLLGPPARRERLLADLGAEATSLRARLRAPVGLDIGADSPESIAVAIVAELQATFAQSTHGPGVLE